MEITACVFNLAAFPYKESRLQASLSRDIPVFRIPVPLQRYAVVVKVNFVNNVVSRIQRDA